MLCRSVYAEKARLGWRRCDCEVRKVGMTTWLGQIVTRLGGASKVGGWCMHDENDGGTREGEVGGRRV